MLRRNLPLLVTLSCIFALGACGNDTLDPTPPDGGDEDSEYVEDEGEVPDSETEADSDTNSDEADSTENAESDDDSGDATDSATDA